MAPDVFRMFHAMGVPLRNIYGATETGLLKCHPSDGFDLETVPARRSINSVAGGRGPIDELLVRSFDYTVAPPVAVVNLKALARGSEGRRRRTRAGG